MRQSFSSVWDAIEDSAPAVENMKFRATIMQALEEHLKAKRWTPAEAADNLGLSEARVSDLMDGKITQFSLDSLVNLAAIAGLHIELSVSTAA